MKKEDIKKMIDEILTKEKEIEEVEKTLFYCD
jgi:hypothetical protein